MRSMLVTDLAFDRRTALRALAGSAAATVIAPATVAARGVDPRVDPADALHAFGKIWSSYDAPVVGAFHGVMYLRIADRAALPVFGMTGTGVTQAKIEASGELTIKSRETCYFTDLATGEVLETWLNPITGEKVEVYHFYDDLLSAHLQAGALPAAVKFEALGDEQTMMSWDYGRAYDNPVTPQGWPDYSTGPRVSPSEHFTFYLPTAELRDRDVPSVKTRGAFARMSQCWPFMRMGRSPARDATLFGRMFSHKGLRDHGEVPPKLLAYVERHAPRYLEIPQGWIARRETHTGRIDTWRAFAGDVPPQTPGHPWTQQPMPPGLAPPTGLAARYRG